jgi:hypothetical protein
VFLSVAQATRSLYEEGEDFENALILSEIKEHNDPT